MKIRIILLFASLLGCVMLHGQSLPSLQVYSDAEAFGRAGVSVASKATAYAWENNARLPHSQTKLLFQALPMAFGHPSFQAVRSCPLHSDGKKIFSPWALSQRLSAVLPMNYMMKTVLETRL